MMGGAHPTWLGSEALHAASAGTITNQRGFPVDDGVRDIGAYEGQLVEIDLIFRNGFE